MGLGLGLVLTKGSGGLSFLKSVPNARVVARHFYELARRSTPLGQLASIEEFHDGSVRVEIVPIEEGIEFRQQGATVVVYGRTSSGGPGYHDYIVSLIDDVVAASKFSVVENDDWQDETGYFQKRNFRDLQEQMAVHFRALCNLIIEQSNKDPGATGFALSMNFGHFPVDCKALAITPRGPRDHAFFEGSGEPVDYFSWWEQGLTPSAAAALTDALLWTAYPWRKACTEEEQALDAAIAGLLAKTTAGETAVRAAFDRARTSNDAPAEEGIGYRRGRMRRVLAGGWSLVVPGYLTEQFDDGTTTFWFGRRHIHISILRADANDDANPLNPFPDHDMTISRTIGDVRFMARIDPYEENGIKSFRLWGGAMNADRLAMVTILFGDMADRDWAEEVLFSFARG